MLEIAICEDELCVADALEELLEKLAKKHRLKISIEVFCDGPEIINEVIKGRRFDIIYMDIILKKKNGLDTAKEIRKYDQIALLIYVTNYESYMASSFDHRPFQYILKPISEENFEKYFIKAYKEILKNDQYFHYKYDKSYYKILIQNIVYFESNKRVINIIDNKGNISKFYGKLDKIEEKLTTCKTDFLRIHQSYLVNFRYISELSYDKIVLNSGKTLYISENRRKKVANDYCRIVGDQNLWL